MAGSRSLGSLTLDLILKAGGFIAGMDKASRDADRNFKKMGDSAERFGRGIGNSLKAATAGFLAFVGVTASVSAAIRGINAAIDKADAIRDLSIRTGIATETLSAFGYAASQTGTDMEALAKGFRVLATNAAAAQKDTSKQAKIFDALGISVTDATGKLKDLDVLVPQIADKFKQMEDGTTKAATAAALFGARNGGQLIEFLNQGAEGLDAFTAKAAELGIIIDGKTATAADNFKDTLGDLRNVVSGVGLSVAKDLLPALQSAVVELIGLAKQGNLAANIASVLSSALSAGVGILNAYTNAVNRVSIAFELLANSAAGFQEIQRNLGPGGFFADGSVAGGIDKVTAAYKEAQAQLDSFGKTAKRVQANNAQPFNVQNGKGQFANVNQSATEIKNAELERALGRALSNPKGPKAGGAKKTGKSDAEKEADDIQKAYERLNESLTQQKTLVGDVTELEKLRYELTQGAAAKIDPIKKAELETLAKEVDAIEAANKMKEEAKNLEESLLTPAEQINKERARAKELLDAGAISQDTYNKALQASLTPYEEVLANLREEIELLGMSADAQDKYMARKAAQVEAGTPEGNEVDRMVQLRNETEETTAAFNEFKDVTADLFSDVIQDSSNAGDALEEWGKRVLAIFAKIAAQKIIDKIFEQSASSAGGSGGGGFWANLFSSFAQSAAGSGGGGHAAGGITNPGMMYPVNENGTELYTENGKDYLLTGSKGGRVSPVGASARGAGVTQIFQTLGLETRRTRERKAQLAGREAQRAIARNGH